MKFPLLIRAASIAAVAAALVYPLTLVNQKIIERQARAERVAAHFAAETSGPQAIVGPLVAIACEETVVVERVVKRAGKEETIAEQKTRSCPTAFFPPRTLDVAGKVPVETLHRGIYPIRLYRAALAFAGEFDWPPPPSQDGAVSRRWKSASVVVATGDARGIKQVSPLAWGAGTLAFVPGRAGDDARFSLEAPLGDYASVRPPGAIAFRFAMELAGTTSLHLVPVGDATTMRLASDWPHPAFMGAFPPDRRTIGPAGFEAAWKTTHFATGGRGAWQAPLERAKPASPDNLTMGFTLVDPVNLYLLSYRAVAYGFLFVLFPFSGLALAEAMAGVRLHPVQYALVGSALAVFFLLLIALAEHVGFALAYLAAATACVALLTFYLRHPLETWKRTSAFLGLFVALYASLYALLLSEDHALLAGSLLVFGALATGMVLTRRTDWAALSARLRSGAAAPAAP